MNGTTHSPHVDIPLAIARAGGRPDLARDLLRMLLDELPGHLAALDRALDRGDAAALRETLHRLGGAAAYCGVPRLEEAVRLLHEAAREGRSATDIRGLVDNLHAAGHGLLAAGPASLHHDWTAVPPA